MWSEISALFREYMGTGLIGIWYVLCLVWLWINEKCRPRRILFLYLPLALLFLYFNPLFAGVVYGVVGSEIYYRILWLLPITIVIAYTCVCIYGQMAQKKKTGAELFALCAAGLIGISGSYVYSSPLFSRAENIYHVPDAVVEICDAIRVPGREVKAAFPLELVQYVRPHDGATHASG